ncbi:conserved membrane protein of unknown function [Rhodovastum atsumiense]|uniref:Uncharacterized protein n=1 Tax=Rhodovastum atsumiense TaxID=504468 RepID=A0A5M6IM62_9PROT|nr:hypothetical protein [Rhodovastum atsumiense]KAA5609336.1 hypothetical protein F1189_24735 [Rhodovastum atsumiense]CAH2602361.1 conserved membrane protein of unknown function [Rhodovastum atsumiense]
MSGSSDVSTSPDSLADAPATTSRFLRWLAHDLPFILMLVLGVIGASWTSFMGRPAVWYWIVLAPVFGLVCIVAGWNNFDTPRERVGLVLLQALNWTAFLIAMYLLFLPEVRGVVNDNADGLSLLTLLALGTFVAGLLARTWRACLVGGFLALAVPAMAWLEQAVMVLALGALALVAFGAVVWRIQHRRLRVA